MAADMKGVGVWIFLSIALVVQVGAWYGVPRYDAYMEHERAMDKISLCLDYYFECEDMNLEEEEEVKA